MTALHCEDCGGKLLNLDPPLNKRTGSYGSPMTRAEAKHLFVETRGGRCTDCYLKARSKLATDLVSKLKSTTLHHLETALR